MIREEFFLLVCPDTPLGWIIIKFESQDLKKVFINITFVIVQYATDQNDTHRGVSNHVTKRGAYFDKIHYLNLELYAFVHTIPTLCWHSSYWERTNRPEKFVKQTLYELFTQNHTKSINQFNYN